MSSRDPQPPDPRYHIVRIRRRRWYYWLNLALWMAALFVFLDFAVNSIAEREMQAAFIAWLVFGFLLLGGLVFIALRSIEESEEDENAP